MNNKKKASMVAFCMAMSAAITPHMSAAEIEAVITDFVKTEAV